MARRLKIKDLGPMKWYLNMEPSRNGETVYLSYSQYIQKAFASHGMENYREATTPKFDTYPAKTPKDFSTTADERTAYHHLVQELIHFTVEESHIPPMRGVV
ncbi:MAG: hypothetical protein M1814_001226 [Vezdaea aestivalis]|nr:MAG: hypothetical protein M1814_001226 [Vezdaea aestivalis]